MWTGIILLEYNIRYPIRAEGRIGNEWAEPKNFGSDSFVAYKIMQQTMCSIHFVRYISKKVRARAENLGSARLVANPVSIEYLELV